MTTDWDAIGTLSRRDTGRPHYERIADTIADAIDRGELRPRERLPTVRGLARQLDVSPSTVTAVYKLLSERHLVSGHAGRGTFVRPSRSDAPDASERSGTRARPHAWRRAALAQEEFRLRETYPNALDLTRGSPDPRLLPRDQVRQAWTRVASDLTACDLGYPLRLDVERELAEVVVERMAADAISAGAGDILAMSSAQQFLSLAAQLICRDARSEPTVAVEEPGYQTAMDTFEHAGCTLVGVAVDEYGVRPDDLEGVLRRHDIDAVLLTPRAQSPTGASWNAERRQAIGAVLRRADDVLVIEDDHLAEATTARCGSLFDDARLSERVLYVRSAGKALGPDLRIAVGAARPRIRNALWAAKAFADGWTSRLTQRALAHLLADPETSERTRLAAATYEQRRSAVTAILAAPRSGLDLARPMRSPRDGLHVWVPLPRGLVATNVVEATAKLGYLLAGGEPFYVEPGPAGHVRVNAGAVDSADGARAAEALLEAIRRERALPMTTLTP